MSDTILKGFFGGWSFGPSSDETHTGRDRTKSFDDRANGSREIDARGIDGRVGRATDDDSVVAQVRAGNAAALRTLFLRYYDPLVEFVASYVGSVDDGEEVVADVFARLWEHRATWTVTAGVSAYLFGAVRNRALNVVRDRSRDRRRTAMLHDLGETAGAAVPSPGLAEQLEHDEYAAAALHLIAKLPERQRTILSLRWNYALAWDAIAAVLGVTSTAVRKEHSRILAALRAELRAL